jgi:hypothetical protein
LRIAFENLKGVPEFINFVLLGHRDLAHLLMQKVDKVTFFRGGMDREESRYLNKETWEGDKTLCCQLHSCIILYRQNMTHSKGYQQYELHDRV